MANILAVDDERDLCALIKTTLERDGHLVQTRTCAADVTAPLCRWADCILLDIMMPGEDGFALCRRIRADTDAPILFLTARTDEPSVLTGLGLGADDYLTKPFRLAELRARVAAHLRRSGRTPAHTLERSGVRFVLAAKSAAVSGQTLPFTKSEYAICEYLALHAGQTFSKEQIYEAVFGYDGSADDTAVTQHIKNIRAKLRAAELPNADSIIKTVWGWVMYGKTKADLPVPRTGAVSGVLRRRMRPAGAYLVVAADGADPPRVFAVCQCRCRSLLQRTASGGHHDRRHL